MMVQLEINKKKKKAPRKTNLNQQQEKNPTPYLSGEDRSILGLKSILSYSQISLSEKLNWEDYLLQGTWTGKLSLWQTVQWTSYKWAWRPDQFRNQGTVLCMSYATLKPYQNQYSLICSRTSCSLVHKVKYPSFALVCPACPCLSYTLDTFLRFVLDITGFVCILICEKNFELFLRHKSIQPPLVIIYLIFP